MTAAMTTRVHILVFDQVEVLDFADPYEVFITASRVHPRSHAGDPPLFAAACVSRDGLVTSAGISSGLDMSLHLLARMGSQAVAERTARQRDYRWQADAQL